MRNHSMLAAASSDVALDALTIAGGRDEADQYATLCREQTDGTAGRFALPQ
jgi:hypothetical protein